MDAPARVTIRFPLRSVKIFLVTSANESRLSAFAVSNRDKKQ